MAIKSYFLFFLLCTFQPSVVEEPVIVWNANYKLTWQDFKARPNRASSAVAITASGITFGFSIDEVDKKVVRFATEIETHFYPEKSWYKPKDANTHILGHEQLHFDITELYARKFRARVSALEVSQHIAKDLRTLHHTITKELAAFQKRYDTETDFSRHIAQQDYWQQFIAEELKTYDAFASKN
jgi:hypothetical protein